MPEKVISEDNPIEQRNKDDEFKKEVKKADKEGGEPDLDKVYEKGILEEETEKDEFDDKGIEDNIREEEEDNVDKLEDGE